jgi:hypothetical protein
VRGITNVQVATVVAKRSVVRQLVARQERCIQPTCRAAADKLAVDRRDQAVVVMAM